MSRTHSHEHDDHHQDHNHSRGHSHGHSHGHGHHHHHAGKNLLTAFLLNLSFAIIELVGGILTGSVAILADAVHDLGDSITLGISVVLEKMSTKKPTAEYTFGFRRLSLLSSLIAGIVISIGSGIILYEAIPQFWKRDSVPNGPWMIALAVLGVSINGFAALRLMKGTSQNEKMLTWHMIEDVLGWVAVLIGAIVITITSWTWIDPLLACGVALFVLYNVSKNLWTTITIFMQRAPDDFDETELTSDILQIAGVLKVRDIHAWSLDGESNILSLHVEVNPTFEFGKEYGELKKSIRAIANKMGKFHTTVEIEKAFEHPAECSLIK